MRKLKKYKVNVHLQGNDRIKCGIFTLPWNSSLEKDSVSAVPVDGNGCSQHGDVNTGETMYI